MAHSKLTAAKVGMNTYRVGQKGVNPFFTGQDQNQMVDAMVDDPGMLTVHFAGNERLSPTRVYFLPQATLCYEQPKPDEPVKDPPDV